MKIDIPARSNEPPLPGTARRIVPPSRRGRIWVLEGRRQDDNAQAHALAGRLSPNYRTRRLHYNKLYKLPNLLLAATLASLERAESDELTAPWPDLVISAGRRSVPVARWIRKQSDGKTRLVQIGRPRAPLDWFDLVVTTPQYGLPEASNVIELDLPFVAPRSDPREFASWHSRFEGLARPWIGVLVGGSGWPYRFDEAQAHKLAAAASRIAHQAGGSALVFASPRTGRVQSKAIERALVVPSCVHHWSGPEASPYQAILSFADHFLVTCDSMSMIAEACETGKPVELFPLPESALQIHWDASAGLAESLARNGIVSAPRNMARLHHRLIENRLVFWHGGARPEAPTIDQQKRSAWAVGQAAVVERISQWL